MKHQPKQKQLNKRSQYLPGRLFRRKSAFVFVSCLGLWMPKAYADVLVDLDATVLNGGPLQTWTNKGTITGNFVSAGTTIPNVTTNREVKGISFLAAGGATGGTQYRGPEAPPQLTGSSSRTIEAWVFNPSAQGEETVFAWGRRGGPDGSNCSFGHGTDAVFGAVGHWGATTDVGWSGKIVFSRWTYIAYTFDGSTASVYMDGVLATSRNISIDTWAFDNTAAGNPLFMRVARQNEATGLASGVGAGEITIARIRVQDTAMDAAAIKAKFDAEKTLFGSGDTDNDGILDYFEKSFAFLNFNDASDATKDQDNDGLTNLQEFQRGTAPDRADTDSDGVNDGAEVNRTVGGAAAATDPLRADTDADGVSDKAESGTGTYVSAADTGSDPLKADTDGDGFNDFAETLSTSDPNKNTSMPSTTRGPVVSLLATNLPIGRLTTWTNTGPLAGVFTGSGNPNVEQIQGIRGVTLNPTGTAQFYTGPAAPSFLTGNPNQTIEAWIYNPIAADEETIFSWGRRGGPNGSNNSFNHGLNAAFGAMGHWGAPDLGWGANGVVTGRWTHVVYTYDSATRTSVAYQDGEETNREELPDNLNIWALDTANRPLPFRVGSQTEAGGGATGALRGTMTIARLQVWDRVLDGNTIKATFNSEAGNFGIVDFDNDGLPTWYERQFSAILNPNDGSDAAKDSDGDGLTNTQEFANGTRPDQADTDGDGVNDPQELAKGTNPLSPDSDNDGLNDRVESGTGRFVSASDTGSNPLNLDSDGDGFTDGQEVVRTSNPNDSISTPSFAKALVELDATVLNPGPLAVWPNNGLWTGNFASPTNLIPVVETLAGINAVAFRSTNYFNGPEAPLFLAGNGSRTVEAWIYNPATDTEETIFAWGRRGGPDGSNMSAIHGTNPTFGAMGLWGAADVGWGSTPLVTGRWTYVAYTYDSSTLTAVAYSDGAVANTKVEAAALNTFALDNQNRRIVFKVGVQNNADSSPGGQFANLDIARIRVYDTALSSDAILAKFNSEKGYFSNPPPPLKFQTVSLKAGVLNFTFTSSQPANIEVSTNLKDWTTLVTGVTSSFSETIPPNGAPYKFYRLRMP